MEGHYILKINNKCNSNCLFCADSRKFREKEDPDIKGILNDIDKNRKKFDSLIITGGEPTISKNLMHIIDYAKKICNYNKISLVSNGFLLYYSNFVDKLINKGIDSFQISYFALDENTYHSLSRFKNSYDYVNEGINNVLKKGKEIRINLVINKLNYKDLPKIVEHLINLKVNSITLAFMNPTGESVKNGKSSLLIPFTTVIPFIQSSFLKSNQYRYNKLYIENFPLCIARDYIDYITDLKKPEENKDYYNSGKTKTNKCLECIYLNICDGVWKEYLNQIGENEIKPIVSNSFLETKNNKDDKIDNSSLTFEFIGLELNIKKASIVYLKKEEIPSFIRNLKNKDYFYETSNFNFLTHDEKTKKSLEKIEEGEFSVYFSKNKKIVERLKFLDYYQQFKLKCPEGINSREIFYEIGNILGYPKCCSEFLMSCHDKKHYENISEQVNKQYEDETIYKIMALKNSKKILFRLNNFNISYPSFFNFFVCSYSCENALNFSNKLLEYEKINNPKGYEKLIEELKKPILFFSAYRIIYFKNAHKKNDIIEYSGCSYDNKALQYLDKSKKSQFINRYKMFLVGNSFKITNEDMIVYKNNNIIHQIKKDNMHDGFYIEFE